MLRNKKKKKNHFSFESLKTKETREGQVWFVQVMGQPICLYSCPFGLSSMPFFSNIFTYMPRLLPPILNLHWEPTLLQKIYQISVFCSLCSLCGVNELVIVEDFLHISYFKHFTLWFLIKISLCLSWQHQLSKGMAFLGVTRME